MHYVIEHLLNGRPGAGDWFAHARALWASIFSRTDPSDTDALAGVMTSKQSEFERICNDRDTGKELMAWSGIAYFYTTAVGFEDDRANALSIYRAFQRSHCSMEVKGNARDAALSYNLIDEHGAEIPG